MATVKQLSPVKPPKGPSEVASGGGLSSQQPTLTEKQAADLFDLAGNPLAGATFAKAYGLLEGGDREFPERLKQGGRVPSDLVDLFPLLRDAYGLGQLPGIIDGQVHLIWAHPEWGNPLVARNEGNQRVLHMVSGLGGENADTSELNAKVVSLAQVSPNVIPMLHFELRQPDQDIAQMRELIRQLPEGRPFGVGEIEWARPFSDVATYRALFEAVADEASGRPVIIDLHTGIISPDAVDAVRPDYGDWLTQFGPEKFGRRTSEGKLDTTITSAIAHDPTPLWPLFREFAKEHPNIRFVLSHPFNPVGENGAKNPSVDMALELPNILLGSSARREEQEQLLQAAHDKPQLFDRIVFQSDGGGSRTLVDWLEMLNTYAPKGTVADAATKTLFANMAGALGVSS